MDTSPGWGLPRYALPFFGLEVWGTCHAWLPLGHPSLRKVRPPGCVAAHSEMCSAAEKYFQRKYLKHEQQGSGVEIAGKSEIRRFCAYVGFKEWGTPAELLGTARQADEDISRWVHYRGIFITTPRGQPLAVLLVGAWEGTLCSQTRGRDENTLGSAGLWDKKSHGA